MQPWQRRQMCLRGGAHLPKRPKDWWQASPVEHREPLITPAPYGFVPNAGFLSQFQIEARFRELLSTSSGNIDKAAFRYFIGSPDKAVMTSQCRVCLELQYDDKNRRVHNKKYGCWGLLTAAYEELHDQECCIICSTPTKFEKWGVPLCPKREATVDCHVMWKFLVCQSESLHEALEFVLEKDNPNATLYAAIKSTTAVSGLE